MSALDLSFNILSGPIPPLPEAGFFFSLDVSHNNLSGPIPRDYGLNISIFVSDLSHNNLSGHIPPDVFKWNKADLSYNDLLNPIQEISSCEARDISIGGNRFLIPAPVALRNCSKLEVLSLSAPAPTWLRAMTRLRVLQILLSDKQPHLDLSSLPQSCQYAKTAAGRVHSIAFWDACSKGTGCVVDLTGSSYQLSRQTRRYACLNKVSILLEGDSPSLQTVGNSTALTNAYGTYWLNSTTFLDDIHLGLSGKAYTGVGFTRVQAGNLCGNPEAKGVIALAYGTFVFSLFLVTVALLVIGRWLRRTKGSGYTNNGKRHWVKVIALYLWGVATAVVPVVDVVTDIVVLSEVWGSWPMWVVLASIIAPFLVAAYSVAYFWVSSGALRVGFREVRMRRMWRPPMMDSVVEPISRRQWAGMLPAVLLMPLGLMGALLFDFLAVLERLGLYLTIGERVISFEAYHDGRVSTELLLESIPQAVFQTGLYVLGSSRATRIYIDEYIFVQSIAIALLSVFVQYAYVLWEAVYTGRSIWAVLVTRFRSSGRPSFLNFYTGDTNIEKIIRTGELVNVNANYVR